MEEMLQYLTVNADDIFAATIQHIALAGSAVCIGLMISLIICSICTMLFINIEKLINFFSFLRLIPGIALLVITMPIIGAGVFPAECSLILITIPSILINTYSGIKNIPASIIDSAYSLGFTEKQIFYKVQLPMAVPFIILGVRTALVDALTIATIAFLMGAGGLGRYVMTGLTINNYSMVVIGSVIITFMALSAEVILGLMQKVIEYRYTGG